MGRGIRGIVDLKESVYALWGADEALRRKLEERDAASNSWRTGCSSRGSSRAARGEGVEELKGLLIQQSLETDV